MNITSKQFISTVAGIVLGTTIAIVPTLAATFSKKEVDQSQYIVMAVPRAQAAYNLIIVQQITNRRLCWRENNDAAQTVQPLLLNFDFTGICGRSTDSNGYSIRADDQDYGLKYTMRFVPRDGYLALIGTPSDRRLPEVEVGRTASLARDYLKVTLNPGWRLTRRVFNGKDLPHLYFTNNADLTTIAGIPTPTPTPTASPTPSPTPSPMPSPTPSPIASPTPIPTPTPTPSPTPTPIVRPTPSPSPTVRPTPSPLPTIRPTPSPTPTPSNSAAGTLRTYQDAAYAVRVFREQGRILMNVFDKAAGKQILNSTPAQATEVPEGILYTNTTLLSGRQFRLVARSVGSDILTVVMGGKQIYPAVQPSPSPTPTLTPTPTPSPVPSPTPSPAPTKGNITLFEHADQKGSQATFVENVPTLLPIGLNDRVSSVVITSGTWQLCSDADYKGRCITLKPGVYNNLVTVDRSLNDQISSIRQIE